MCGGTCALAYVCVIWKNSWRSGVWPSTTLRSGVGLRLTPPEVYRRLRGEIKRKSSTWHMDETFVRTAGKWKYLFRAVDSH